MPSDQCNSIMARATGLIFSLFDVTSAREVPFDILQYVQCILQGLTSVLLCIPSIFAHSESINLVIAGNGFLCVTEIVRFSHSDYLDYSGVFQTVLGSYCCVTS